MEDPCETRDVASQHPDIVASLKSKLEYWETKTVPQLNTVVDPECDPRRFGLAWVPWKDVQPFNNILESSNRQIAYQMHHVQTVFSSD